VDRALLVAGCNPAVLLEAVHQPFDPVPLSVRLSVERRVSAISGALIAPARNHRMDLPAC
jgi:hypothetical protein